MKSIASAALILLPALTASADEPIERIPLTSECEEVLALSALPLRLRDQASVVVLDGDEYRKTISSDGPFTCIVERNHPQSLIPQCADAAGRDTIIPAVIAKSLWALDGVVGTERQARFDERVADGTFRPPARPGIAYMVSDYNYVWNGAANSRLRVPPHVMFYAPGLEEADMGGSMAHSFENRGMPFLLEAGIHGYMISYVDHGSNSAAVERACAGQLPPAPATLGGLANPLGHLRTAIDAPHRTEQDRAQDANRKPLEFMQFAGIRPGAVVAEINAGAGYSARLLPAAVGRDGRVYATNADFVLALFDGLQQRLDASLEGIDNVETSVQRDAELELPEAVDIAILNNNYHDLHWRNVDVAAFNRAVYEAVRPGGVFVVGDHRASPGSDLATTAELHRIDLRHVIAEVEAAGFELAATADFLANPADSRQLHVTDPSIRGKTDRFLLRFRKPAD